LKSVLHKTKKPDSAWLIGLNSVHRFKLALAVFVRGFPVRPQAKVKSAQCAQG